MPKRKPPRKLIPPGFQVFSLYNLSELVEKTGYSAHHLLSIQAGSRPAGERFRRSIARDLGHPVSALFSTNNAALQEAAK
jgi:hypothetical protein